MAGTPRPGPFDSHLLWTFLKGVMARYQWFSRQEYCQCWRLLYGTRFEEAALQWDMLWQFLPHRCRAFDIDTGEDRLLIQIE